MTCVRFGNLSFLFQNEAHPKHLHEARTNWLLLLASYCYYLILSIQRPKKRPVYKRQYDSVD